VKPFINHLLIFLATTLLASCSFESKITVDFLKKQNSINSSKKFLAPEFNFTYPIGGASEVPSSSIVSIAWEDDDLDSNASISLYSHTTNSAECDSGTLLISNLNEDDEGAGDQYDWDNSAILNGGQRYFCAIISDESHTIEKWSDSLNINDAPDFSFVHPIGNDDTISAGSNLTIDWSDLDIDDNATITLYARTTTAGACSGTLLHTEGVNDATTDTYDLDTSPFISNFYYICATIDDGVNPPTHINSGKFSISRDCAWQGLSADWNDNSNWTNCGGIPPQITDYTILAASANDPVITANSKQQDFWNWRRLGQYSNNN
jgi:hypothetical protein